MPQGTVKHFDPETFTGTLLTDAQEELPFDTETFRSSGLLELRLGQRVRFQVEQGDEGKRVKDLQVISL
jgi:cold shock CspA family protein